MSEDRAVRLKRLTLRSGRRGIREMDLILGAFAATGLRHLGDADLDRYERLLAENDHDLLSWVTGAAEAPEKLAALVARIARVRPVR